MKSTIHPSHLMSDPFCEVRAPVGTSRFYSVITCTKCEGEDIKHPAGHFTDPELLNPCIYAEDAEDVESAKDASCYVLQPTDKSFCPTCGSNLALLIEKELVVGPSFYICWKCELILQAGVGVVMLYEER
jgi:hypothetical protein